MGEHGERCGLCKHYHKSSCPNESSDLIKQGIYHCEEDSEPFDETCFEPSPKFERNMEPEEAAQALGTGRVLEYVLEDLGKRVKRDLVTKVSVLASGVSAYLPEPINLFLKGPSGVGKTYNTVESLKYFPEEDVWYLGGMSPKAIIHDYGVVYCEDGAPLESLERPEKPRKSGVEDFEQAKEEYRRKAREYREKVAKSYTLINMNGKIVVFLESPDPETFRILYPILSHDKKRIEYKFTDRTVRDQLRTVKVVIEGWPACIFLTADRKYVEEASTRGFTASPEMSKEKYAEALMLENVKASSPWACVSETGEFNKIRAHIKAMKQFFSTEGDVIIPFNSLHELFPKEIPRDMRDFQHFIQFLKALTALHFHARPRMLYKGKTYALACAEDIEEAINMYSQVFETTRTGTEQQILDFYYKVVADLGQKEYWTIAELTQEYNRNVAKKVSGETVRRWLNRLVEIGYVDVQENPTDRRSNIYTPLQKGELPTISHKEQICLILGSVLEKGLKDWIKNIHNTGLLEHDIIFLSPEHTSKDSSKEMKLEEVFKVLLGKYFDAKKYTCSDKPMLWIILEPENSPKTENLPENSHTEQMCQIMDNSSINAVYNTSDQHPGQDGKDKIKPENSTQIITVTSVTSVTKTCGDCVHHQKMACTLHPEWATVMPSHPACEKFTPKKTDSEAA